jgi:hypothetical protein
MINEDIARVGSKCYVVFLTDALQVAFLETAR